MAHALAPLLARPHEAGVFLDFDGTLSEIVPVASEARPVEGVRELLAGLATSFGVVAVVSGRSARELLEWLGPEVEIWGVHGAQRTVHGRVTLSAAVRPYEELMGRVRTEAERAVAESGIAGIAVEDKGVVVTLHHRAATDGRAGAVVDEVARALAEDHALELAPGRMSVELRPPVELSKAAVVRDRVRSARLAAVMFVGDDTVDLPAFDALDELASEGIAAVRVGVDSDEAPPELIERADVVVDGPTGVLELLRRLAPES
ncbi:MAG: trehalose-phosphatase [Actinomycetota bacterium]